VERHVVVEHFKTHFDVFWKEGKEKLKDVEIKCRANDNMPGEISIRGKAANVKAGALQFAKLSEKTFIWFEVEF